MWTLLEWFFSKNTFKLSFLIQSPAPQQRIDYFITAKIQKNCFNQKPHFKISNWDLSAQHFPNTGFVNDKQIWYSVNQFSIPLTQLWSQHSFVCDKDWELSNGRLYLFIIYKTYLFQCWSDGIPRIESQNWPEKIQARELTLLQKMSHNP